MKPRSGRGGPSLRDVHSIEFIYTGDSLIVTGLMAWMDTDVPVEYACPPYVRIVVHVRYTYICGFGEETVSTAHHHFLQ